MPPARELEDTWRHDTEEELVHENHWCGRRKGGLLRVGWHWHLFVSVGLFGSNQGVAGAVPRSRLLLKETVLS